MRTTSRLLAIACLLTAAHPALAGRRGKIVPPPPTYAGSWVVTGYGVTADEAEADALVAAARKVADWLAKNHPALAWTPPPAYLKDHGLARPLDSPTVKDLELSGKMMAVTMRVTITPELVDESLRMARRERMAERQRALAVGLGGAAVGLMLLGGWLRLAGLPHARAWRMLVLTTAGVGTWLLLAYVEFYFRTRR
jgi:hypothetical protein